MLYRFSLLILLASFFGCKKENITPKSSLTVPILTGFEYRNVIGDIYHIIGNPNIKLNDSKEGNPDVYTYSFIGGSTPNINPYNSQYESDISFYAHSKVTIDSINFWIEKGAYNEVPNQISREFGSQNFISNPRLAEVVSTNALTGYLMIRVIVMDFEPGYYRAYLRINDVLLWDNLIINKNSF